MSGGAHFTDRGHPGTVQRQARRRSTLTSAGSPSRPDASPGTGSRPTVAGEHPPGSVGAVGGRRQPEHQTARPRITEAGHAATPVVLVAERRPLLRGDLLTPCDQPRAAPAGTDVGGQAKERIHGLHTSCSIEMADRTSTPIVDAVPAGAPRADADDWQDAARPRPGSASCRRGPARPRLPPNGSPR